MAHEKCRAHQAHRLSCDEYDELYERADTACEICRIPEHEAPREKLHIDHDRALGNGAVRGLLCLKCNIGLGRIDSGVKRPSASQAEYLERAWHLTAPRRRIGGGAAPARIVRMPQQLWDELGDAAAANGTDRGKVLRAYMRRYVAAWKGRQPKRGHDASPED